MRPRGPEDVVRRFCAAVEGRDAAAISELVTSDVVYHNVPMEPIAGRQAVVEVFVRMFARFERIEFEILLLAERDGAVLTERADWFERDGRRLLAPVMGVFEIAGGRIRAWRDYFDLGQVAPILAP